MVSLCVFTSTCREAASAAASSARRSSAIGPQRLVDGSFCLCFSKRVRVLEGGAQFCEFALLEHYLCEELVVAGAENFDFVFELGVPLVQRCVLRVHGFESVREFDFLLA